MSRHHIPLDCKVYVGDLANNVTENELHKEFSRHGHLRNVWVARNPPGFAFIEFEDPRDADDAVRNLDGFLMKGSRIRVEHSTGKVRPKPWMRRPSRQRRPFDPDDKCYECGVRGHYAYDCRRRHSSGSYSQRRRRRNHSRSRSRSSSRSRSRSRSKSRSRSRSRSRSCDYRRRRPSDENN